MKIRTGMRLMDDLVDVPGDRVVFVTDDGDEMFEVRIGKNGKSIDIRGIDDCRVNGEIYSCALDIKPHVSNSITIAVRPYEKD